MYVRKKPLFPRLHRCKWCKRRLDKNDDTIAYEVFLDGVGYEGYFCSEDCARAELRYKKYQIDELEKLNERIENGKK